MSIGIRCSFSYTAAETSLHSACDFVIFRAEKDELHIEKITQDENWVATNIPKFEQLYSTKIVSKLLSDN